MTRHLHILGATGAVRTATYDGREHLVVPVVALMEGVIHAVNAATPEFVSLATLQRAAHTWNGRPIVLGHPARNGSQISANEPSVRDAQAFGTVFNARIEGKKLLCEAWIDPAKAERIGAGDLLQKIRAGQMTEVSVGAFVVTDDTPGTHNGKAYKAAWRETTGDHLAFLPVGRGACSIEMGCGSVRAAGEAPVVHEVTDDELKAMTPSLPIDDKKGKKRNAQEHPMTLRERLKSIIKALAGAYDTPEEVASEEAAELVAYNVLQHHLDVIQQSLDEASTLVEALIADEEENPTQTPAQETAEEEVETARLEAIMSLLGTIGNAASHGMSTCMNLCAPEMPPPSDPRYMEARAAIGKKISAATMKQIQAAHDSAHAMHDHTTTLGAECSGSPTTLAANSAKNDGGMPAEGDRAMTKEQRDATIKTLTGCDCSGFSAADQKMLEAATDEQLTAFQAHTDKVKADRAALKAAEETKAAALKAAAEAKPRELTEAEFMAAAPASVKALIENERVRVEARTTELVAALKTAQSAYSEDELKALSLDGLEKLAQVAKLGQSDADYSGRGVAAPRTTSKTEDFTPPSGYDAALKTLKQTTIN